MKKKAIEIIAMFEQGKKPKDLINEGMNVKTVYRYYKRYRLYCELKQMLWKLICESL